MRRRESTLRGGNNTSAAPRTIAATASVRAQMMPAAFASLRQRNGAASSAASYAAMHHAGAGVIGIAASGNALSVSTTPSIQAKSHELRFAVACASGSHHDSASCAAASAMVNATQGTTAKFATTAYGANCRKTAAPSGQVPNCVATERTSASRSRSGIATALSSQRSKGAAQAKIAPTHENESANEADATLDGRAKAMTIAAIASAFQEKVARPQARAASAAVAIVAARTAGSCAPLHQTKSQTMAIAMAHVSARGMASALRSNVTSAVTAPKCKPAVTRTCTVPVSWNSARSAGGIAARSPHNSPDTTEAAGSPNRRRNCSCAQACARANHVRASPVAFAIDRENRRALEPAVHAALGLDRAFARLAGIARLVEWFQTTANQHARTGRYAFAHASAPPSRRCRGRESPRWYRRAVRRDRAASRHNVPFVLARFPHRNARECRR